MRLVWDDFEPSIDKDKRDFYLATLGTNPSVGGSARIRKMLDDAIKRREEWGKQSQPTATPAAESAKSNR
jgi:hypothetical protein